MPKTHTPKSTAPDGEPPSTEGLVTEPEEGASGERLGRIGAELGRLATGRRFYEPKPSDSQPPVDESERLRAALRAAGKLDSEAGSEPSTREEVLAALRGGYLSPAAKETNSGSDSSVADTESASVAPENQDELGNSDEQDPNESPEVSDKQSPSASEALKRLAEADTTQLTIRNMAGAAEDLARVLNTADALRAPVLFGRIQEYTSGISTALNRFSATVEKVGGDLPLDEAARLRDAIDQVRHALAVMNNVAEQGFSRRIGGGEYSQRALQLNNSIEELQRFMNLSVERQENKEHNQ